MPSSLWSRIEEGELLWISLHRILTLRSKQLFTFKPKDLQGANSMTTVLENVLLPSQRLPTMCVNILVSITACE